MNRLQILCLCGAIAASIPTVFADRDESMRPEICRTQTSELYISRISNSGLWGVSPSSTEDAEGMTVNNGGILINISDMSEKTITSENGWCEVSDVTDDGNIVAGGCDGKPAYYTVSTGKWTLLDTKDTENPYGLLLAITPDGKYAVGQKQPDTNGWKFRAVMFDLTTGEAIDLPGIDHTDRNGYDQYQNRATDVSPDGNYVFGQISVSYPADEASYVYDRSTQTFIPMGFEISGGKWIPLVNNLYSAGSIQASPNGKWATGGAYIVKEIEGSQYPEEYTVAYRFDVENRKFEVIDNGFDHDCPGFAITSDGVVLGASPATNPYSELMIQRGNYFYNFNTIMALGYGVNFKEAYGLPVTGKPCSVSEDGLTLAQISSTTDGWILKLKESVTDASKRISLLGNCSVSPAIGSTFSKLTTVRLTFDRNIALAMNAEAVKLLDGDGNVIDSALRATVEGTSVTVRFIPTNLDAGKTYKVHFPQGFLSVLGDPTEVTGEFDVTYTGRGTNAVNVVRTIPADGTALSQIDAAANPIIMTFDATLGTPTEGLTGQLYEDGQESPISEIRFTVSGNQLYAFTPATQYLFKGSNYTVEIPAGVVADMSGAGFNEAVTLHYEGSYVRQASGDDKYLFTSNCNNPYDFMFYEGDHNEPSNLVKGWSFTKDIPWWYVASTEDTGDMAMASHSMYTPAGKSDDWMTTPAIYIPAGSEAILEFDSQSYLKSKSDRLKVIIYTDNTVYNTLSSAVVDKMRDGDVVYDAIESPGDSEENLEGDWKHNTVSLAAYAGKQIYVAFVNQNENQSAIFVDNIRISRNAKFSAFVTSKENVVKEESQKIEMQLVGSNKMVTYDTVNATLYDAEGNEVSKFAQSGIGLGEGDIFNFSFDKELPLTVGKETAFKVYVKLDDEELVVDGTVKNLAFEPVKRVILEEMTGVGCPNCPLGILAIDKIHSIYGDRFIPIAIHTYTGDPYSSGLDSYTSFLGLNAAPTGRINRGAVASPMISVGLDYRFSGAGLTTSDGSDPSCWLDLVQNELAETAEMGVEVTYNYNADSKEISIPVRVTPALDIERRNLNLLYVMLEDGLVRYQDNNLGSVEDEDLGKFGKGGEWSNSRVAPFTHNHVARAVYGDTYNGTGGYFPQTLKAGETFTIDLSSDMSSVISKPENTSIVAIVIDANTGGVINAAMAKVGTSSDSAVSEISSANALNIVRNGATFSVASEGDITIEAYTTDGMQVAESNGNGSAAIDLSGVNGMVILRATAAEGSTTLKVIL